jgi:oxygen tolerance protein BatD
MKHLRRYPMPRLLLTLGLFLVLAPSVSTADEGIILRTSIEPKAGIWVGQQVRLLIDVLARDGWAQIGKFHPFEVSGASVLQVDSHGTRLADTVSGATWSGQHYEWLVFPQRAGNIAIPPIVVDVETKDVATQETTPVPDQKTPAVAFQAVLPPGADQEHGLISTTRLEATQTLEPATAEFKVGDALKRSISLRAAAISGMAFEPVQYAPVAGVGIYPGVPVVQDAVDRGSLTEGRRMESVTYVFEREGNYVLPDVTVTWWDLGEKHLRREVLPGPHVRVVLAAPATTADGGTSAPASGSWPRWLGIAAVAGVAALGAGLYWRQAIRARYQAWSLARNNSEAAYFRRFIAAARTGDVPHTLNAVLRWLDRLEAGTAPAQLGHFVQRYGDEAVRHEAQQLERLVATGRQEAWDAAPLVRGMTQARQRRLQAGRQQSPHHTVVPPLNPCNAEDLSAQAGAVVACVGNAQALARQR